MSGRDYSALIDYRNAIASATGPDSATMRHILLTLSLHMDRNLSSCWPSIKTLAARTGLNEKTVRNQLKQAEKKGWIKRGTRGANGKGWRLYCYVGKVPNRAEFNTAPSVDNSCANSAHAEFNSAHAEFNSAHADPSSNIVRAENPTNRSINRSRIDQRICANENPSSNQYCG